MKKKLTLVVLLILTMLCLSGCEMIDNVKKSISDMQTSMHANSAVSNAGVWLQYDMSDRTYQAINDSVDATVELSKWENTTKTDVGIFEAWRHGHLFRDNYIEAETNKAQAKVDRTSATAARLASADPVLQHSMNNDDGGSNGNSIFKKPDKKGMLIIILVIVALIVVIFIILNKRSYAPRVVRTPGHQQIANPSYSGMQQTGAVSGSTAALCRSYCRQHGLNFEDELRASNNDPEVLYARLMK